MNNRRGKKKKSRSKYIRQSEKRGKSGTSKMAEHKKKKKELATEF